ALARPRPAAACVLTTSTDGRQRITSERRRGAWRRDPRSRRPSRARAIACQPSPDRCRARAAAGRQRPRRRARPLRALSRLPDRRRRRAGGARRCAARRLAAPGPLVRHAAAPQALVRRRARVRLGIRPGRRRAARQGRLARRQHRRRRRLVPARRLQPLLLRRLPAALRADRGAVRHALPAAARAPRRASLERRRTRRARDDLRAEARRVPELAGDGVHRGLRRVPCPRDRTANRPLDGTGLNMEHSAWLSASLVYLAAAVLAVPIARFAGLGSIIGYLAAGILIGPWGLKLVTRPDEMLQIAEFGVVLMLFLVGLELEPQRLWALRKPIFGWGSVQLFGSALLLALAALAFGVDWRLAVVAALGLAMSSTAIGLGILAERNILATTSGESILSVSLLQDIAAIPILALIPFLAAQAGAAGSAGGGWLGAAKVVGTIAAIFTAASLLLVVATAALMDTVGLSMAMGAFLAGVLLAESEYRRELETDIEPFKGLLLGLFFIAVGMSIDFAVLLESPG